ncbi:MAG: hypothetical protein AB2A00_11750 [Myxococcota bacterium]
MPETTVDDEHFRAALQEALARYPRFAELGPRLVKVQLRAGHTFLVRYQQDPDAKDPDAWEFQNAVVKAYRRRAGI